MCKPIVERRQTLAQLDMNADTAATSQREIMMLMILWTSFFKMELTLKLKVRMIDGFIVALLLLSFCNLVDYIFRHLYIYFKMTYLLLK